MGKSKISNNGIRSVFLKNSIDDFLRLSCKTFFAGKYIDGDNKTDNKVPQNIQHIDDADGYGADKRGGTGNDKIYLKFS